MPRRGLLCADNKGPLCWRTARIRAERMVGGDNGCRYATAVARAYLSNAAPGPAHSRRASSIAGDPTALASPRGCGDRGPHRRGGAAGGATDHGPLGSSGHRLGPSLESRHSASCSNSGCALDAHLAGPLPRRIWLGHGCATHGLPTCGSLRGLDARFPAGAYPISRLASVSTPAADRPPSAGHRLSRSSGRPGSIAASSKLGAQHAGMSA